MADPYKEIYDDTNDVYDEDAIEEMLDEDDSISPKEEAFMQGYNQALKKKKKKKSKPPAETS